MKKIPSISYLSSLLSSLFLLIALAISPGCRREDLRSVTLTIPGLTPANQSQVIAALQQYDGVKKDSFVWDLPAKTLTLTYDSMKVAQSNLRYSIEEKGISVAFPPPRYADVP